MIPGEIYDKVNAMLRDDRGGMHFSPAARYAVRQLLDCAQTESAALYAAKIELAKWEINAPHYRRELDRQERTIDDLRQQLSFLRQAVAEMGGVSMAEYHITRGPHGIYAGTRLKKTECTQEAILAVRDHLIVTFLDGTAKAGGYRWKTIDGRIIALHVHVTGGEHPAHDAAGKQADVAPVVHGWWKTVTGSNGKAYMVCTICRKQQALNGVFAYCPNCGARMDGGADNATD